MDGVESQGQLRLLLTASEAGDAMATSRLVALLYEELRTMARGMMAHEGAHGGGHTLQATALVHEAWMRLGLSEDSWQSRAHFMGAAAQAMRRLLIDHARRRRTAKRGGSGERVELDEDLLLAPPQELDLLDLDDALTELAAAEERKAQLVTLRYFGGLTIEEAAEALGISLTTAKSDWTFARLWLFKRMGGRARIPDAT